MNDNNNFTPAPYTATVPGWCVVCRTYTALGPGCVVLILLKAQGASYLYNQRRYCVVLLQGSTGLCPVLQDTLFVSSTFSFGMHVPTFIVQ